METTKPLTNVSVESFYEYLKQNPLAVVPQFNFDNLEHNIAQEMERYKKEYNKGEEQFVTQMLTENPIAIPSRTATNFYTSSSEESVDDHLRRRRSEASRKSRFQSKINKAKYRYRHQYICANNMKNIKKLENLWNIIRLAETELLNKGCSTNELKRLRTKCGIDRLQRKNNVEKDDNMRNIHS
ncbi:protein sisterless A-like [Teleopsis dalmanni]|uniref:protein sisterless A-like n=1 Tax=Teleopsis dalmanni TaxID=139649 RepID=UPI0018CCE3B0|nr:protein sisterless A-like [Teleopsis dalmanni]